MYLFHTNLEDLPMNAIFASMYTEKSLRFLQATLLFVALMTLSLAAMAGTGGDTVFSEAYDQIADFTTGFLGKLITLLMIVTGLIMGIARQSIMTLVVGVGMGIALFNAPAVVNTLVSAVL